MESKSTAILSFNGLILHQAYVTSTGNLNPHRQKNHNLKKITVIEKNPHQTTRANPSILRVRSAPGSLV